MKKSGDTTLEVEAVENTPSATPYRALIVLCTAAFLVPFMGSSLNLALPQISAAFNMKAVTLTWMATAYIISTAIFQIPFARVADIVGRKKIFQWGIALFSTCTALCGLSPSAEVLIALRFLSGIGSAMMFGTNIAILTSLFPSQNRGRALGINSAVVYAAAAAGPFLGGLLTHYLGWHSIFFVTAGIGYTTLVLSKSFLKGEWIEARGEKFDVWGTLLFGIALAGIIYGFSNLPNNKGFVCLIGGLIALIFFIFYEKDAAFPIVNVRLFRTNRVYALSSMAALINYAATSGIGFMLSLYLQYIRGFDASRAGLILISQALVQSAFSLIAGNASRRISPEKLATAGMGIIVLGLIGLIFLSPTTHIVLLIGNLVLLGVGFGIFSSPNTNVIMSSVEQRYYTQASATTGTVRLTGQAFSLGIAGMAISIHVGDSMIVPSLYPQFMTSMQTTFIIFVVLCSVGVYAASVRNRKIGK